MPSFIKPYNNDPFVGHFSTPVTTSSVTKTFLSNLPAYRSGLSPLLRGLEIGMAHGYLLVGPFEKLGPLRNSEIGVLAGYFSSIGLISILTVCLKIYGQVSFQKSSKTLIPKNLPNKDLLNKKGWDQFSSGFFVGSLGGASFAYLLLLNFIT